MPAGSILNDSVFAFSSTLFVPVVDSSAPAGSANGRIALNSLLPVAGGTMNGPIFFSTPANWTGTLVNQALTFTNIAWNGSSGADLVAGLAAFWQIQSNVNFGSNGQAAGVMVNMRNGTSTVGGVIGANFNVTISSTSSNTTSVEYVGLRAAAFATANDGGISGTPRGNLYGQTIQSSLANAAATFWERQIGLEIGMEGVAGATVSNRAGLYILQYNDTSAERGSSSDRAIGIWNQFAQSAANGWQNGIDIGPGGQAGLYWPLGQDATVIKLSKGASDGNITVANVIDGSMLTTVTGNNIALPNFVVTGAGQVGGTGFSYQGAGNHTLVYTSGGDLGHNFINSDGSILQIANQTPGTAITATAVISAGQGSILINTTGSATNQHIFINAGGSAGIIGFQPGAPTQIDHSGNITGPSMGNGSTALQVTGSGSWTANGTTAVSLTSVAPAGAHATVQEWLTFKDAAGTVRYIPAF